MTNPVALACECGSVKTKTPSGLLMCEHCDTGVCTKTCALDRKYSLNVSRRLND